jgi:mitogen-activated protein kinase kinase kinase 1
VRVFARACLIVNLARTVWSFGVTVWEVLTRQNPYPSMDLIQVATAVCYKNLSPEPPAGTPTVLRDVLARCFRRKPEERPHMREIVQMLA